MSRIDNIKNFAQKREEDKVVKELAAQQRIEDYKKQIIALKPRIDEIIEVGNACRENNIPIACDCGCHQGYDTHYFYTNGWSHLLGFVDEVKNGRRTSITKLGIQGGGCCHYDLKTDGITVDVSGSDTEYVLKRFVNEFDEFETEFYKYIDGVTQGK